MNVTALNNYLKCPLEFYFKNLVRIPSGKNEAPNLDLQCIMPWKNYSGKCRMENKIHFLPKRNSLQILNGIWAGTVKVLPEKNLNDEWNTDRSTEQLL